jgi:putative transposase
MNELKNRGVSDVLIAVVDRLKGFPEAINAVFRQPIVQTCIVHLIRHSMDFACWKDRKVLAGALKAIYRAQDADPAKSALEAFDTPLRRKISGDRPELATQLAARHSVLRLSGCRPADHLHRQRHRGAQRKNYARAVRTRGHFPTDDAATKLLFLVLRQAAGEWKTPPREWFEAKTQFAIMFDERFVQA